MHPIAAVVINSAEPNIYLFCFCVLDISFCILTGFVLIFDYR